MRGLHHIIKQETVIAPVAVGTTGTGQTGRIVDRRGYRRVEFIAGYGAITSTAAIFTATVKEGDTTGAMTSVADADLEGTELGLGLGAAVRTDFVGDKVFRRCGYKGLKRYVQVNIKSTATAAPPIDCVAILHEPESMPVAT